MNEYNAKSVEHFLRGLILVAKSKYGTYSSLFKQSDVCDVTFIT